MNICFSTLIYLLTFLGCVGYCVGFFVCFSLHSFLMYLVPSESDCWASALPSTADGPGLETDALLTCPLPLALIWKYDFFFFVNALLYTFWILFYIYFLRDTNFLILNEKTMIELLENTKKYTQRYVGCELT